MIQDKIKRREAIKLTAYLMGAAVSASAVAAVMTGCQSDAGTAGEAKDVTAGWEPVYLSKDQTKLVEAATERIIPATDTPGAKEAKVNRFIDIYLKDNARKEEQEGFLKGLAALDSEAQAAYSKKFVNLTDEQQDEVLTKLMNREADQEFFFGLKQLTLLGFFTSEVGATQVLKYNKIPGDYQGCIPFSEVGVTWAT